MIEKDLEFDIQATKKTLVVCIVILLLGLALTSSMLALYLLKNAIMYTLFMGGWNSIKSFWRCVHICCNHGKIFS